jgi:biotin carboxyl carrier protein
MDRRQPGDWQPDRLVCAKPMPVTKYQVTIADRVLEVSLRHAGDQCFARIDDGEEQPVQLTTLHGALRSLAVGERRAELFATHSDHGMDLVVAGVDYQADVVDEIHARLRSVAGTRAASHARRELKAPMPGLLVSILCQVGDAIEPGQPLAVLQAMKMENELSLPRGGTVTSIPAEAGQTVEQGQVLVVVE